MNFFSMRTNHQETIKSILNNKEILKFGTLSWHRNEIGEGDIVFVVISGDQSKKEINYKNGLKAIGIIVSKPVTEDETHFSVKTKIEVLFDDVLTKEDFYPYPKIKNAPNIGPDTTNPPNQALRKISSEQAISILQASIDLLPEQGDEIYKAFSQILINAPNLEKMKISSIPIKNLNNKRTENSSNNKKSYDDSINDNFKITADNFYKLITTLSTKPFVLLAGFSGTGKSRLVRSLAYKFNNIAEDKTSKKHPPTNFQLVKVKPNWHDSSDLLGYESRISGKDRFIVTDFIKFVIKAHQYPNTPFFLCLDEMNLAPVEQYFAEYLSVIETRVLNIETSTITTDTIISNTIFKKYADKTDGVDTAFNLWKELELTDEKTQEELKTKGLTLPQNLIVMGTVNMDETTHSFSRKVLDRAMTLEMNEIDLSAGLDIAANEWSYSENPVPAEYILSEKTHGYQVYEEIKEDADKIIKYLEKLNYKLEASPFKIAYRGRDEFLLYAYNYNKIEDKPSDWLTKVIDQMTLMKILPRIEGDEDKTKILEDLLIIFREYSLTDSMKKAEEMENRRKSYHYTSFWS